MTHPFLQISIDLITNLPESGGFDSVMVVVDHGLTKGVILSPCKKTITSEGVAQLFFKKVFLRFGLYDKIISDRGPQFASKFAKELGRLLDYEVALSTAYHPQTDGQTERLNQELETYLCIYCCSAPLDWVKHLLPNSAIPAAEDQIKYLQKTREEAIACHNLAMQRMAARSYGKKFEPWKVGEKVWLSAKNLISALPSKKLAPKRYGPFTVEAILSPITFKIRLPSSWKSHPVFHASELSSYQETEVHGPNNTELPPDIINGQEEYKIKAVLAHKGNIKGKHRFLMSWKGYPSSDNSWIPEKEMNNTQEILKTYKKHLRISRLLTN
jgi:hypothetical protein